MKTIIKMSTVVFIIATLLVSCNKDNADPDPTPDPDPIPENKAPNSFNLKGVTNGASGVDLLPKFTWDTATDPDGDAVTYNLYMDGNENPTTLIAENLTATEYQTTDNLPLVAQYYWKVVAKDAKGKTTTSNDTYNFTTRSLNITRVTNSPDFGKRYKHTSVVFNDKLWVIKGSDGNRKGDIWSSVDGENWTLDISTGNGVIDHASVIYNNKIFTIGGLNSFSRLNSVTTRDSDGKWKVIVSHANFSPRQRHAVVVFKDKMWVIGGLDDNNVTSIFNSTDGITWTQIDTPPVLEGRFGHTATVFNDKLWVIGGVRTNNNNGVYKNDVWFTEDGVNWTEATAHAEFSERQLHTTVVYDNKLWVLGGVIDNGNLAAKDLWYSTDGTTWKQATDNAQFGKLFAHTTVTFKDKIWVIGGSRGEAAGVTGNIWTLD